MAKRSTKRRSRQSAEGGLSFRKRSKRSRSTKKTRVLAIQFFPPRTPARGRPKAHKQLAIPLSSTKALEISLFAPKALKRGRPARSGPRELAIPLKLQTALVIILIIAGLAGSIIFGFQVIRAEIPPPDTVSSIETPVIPLDISVKPRGMSRSAPTMMRIPAIGVNTSFVELGKQADGTMEVPKEYHVAGWYRYAPTPGQIGPAILVGHVDNYLGAAVFYRLRELKPGDIVEVDRADGATVKFKVNSLKQFDQANFPTQEVYGNIDYAGLRLITCSGQFNRSSGSYTHNTVVFASKI